MSLRIVISSVFSLSAILFSSMLFAQSENSVEVSSKKKFANWSHYKTTKLDEDAVRFMKVCLNKGENYVMVGKTAQVSGDSASKWSAGLWQVVKKGKGYEYRQWFSDENIYDGKKDVEFKGLQMPAKNVNTKIYRPQFTGKAEIRGGGGSGGGIATKEEYDWKVVTQQEVGRGTVKVKAWVAVSPTYIAVDVGNPIPFGPIITPEEQEGQQVILQLLSWCMEQANQTIREKVQEFFKDLLNKKIDSIVKLAESIRDFSQDVAQRINIVTAQLKASQLASTHIKGFDIGNANGGVLISYTHNNREVERKISVDYNVSAAKRFPEEGFFTFQEAIDNGHLARLIKDASKEWSDRLKRQYQSAIKNAITQELGNGIDVQF